MTTLVDTTFTAKDIHTALSVYEYTVPAGGHYALRFQVRLYQVAGGGDYMGWLALNDGDALADDPMVPKTTYTAAAGAQNMWFQTINVDAMTGDVINVMVLGLAGDTAVVGSIRIFTDAADVRSILGTALTETSAGYMAAAFKKLLDVATPVLTSASVNQTGDSYAGVTRLVAGLVPVLGTVVADAGNSTLQFKTDLASAVENFYRYSVLVFTSGALTGQSRIIDWYTTGKIASFGQAWTSIPATNATFVILPIADYFSQYIGSMTALAACVSAGSDSYLLVSVDNRGVSLPNMGADGGVLISTDPQDLSTTLDVNAKTLGDAAVDAIMDEYISPAVHATAGSLGDRILKSGYIVKNEGTCLGGAAQTITLAATASAVVSIYCQDLITIIYGTGIGQSRMVVAYSAAKVATVDRPWDVTPISGDSVYQVTAFSGILLAASGKAAAATVDTITLDGAALAVANSYIGSIIYISSGTGMGQARIITAYTVTRIATIEVDWDTTPDTTSAYKIIPTGRSYVVKMNQAALDEIWANTSRTLTSTAASVAAALSGSAITCRRGDTLTIALTGLGTLANYTSLYFTVKKSEGDTDAESLVQIKKNASGLLDGLIYLNGAAGTAANGSIAIDNAVLGNITITLNATETDDLICQESRYDVQIVRSVGVPVSTLTEGVFQVVSDLTWAVT